MGRLKEWMYEMEEMDERGISVEAIQADAEQLLKKLQAQPRQVGMFRVRTANESINDAQSQKQPRNLYENLIFEGEITLLFADTGVGKSIFAVQVANKISETDKVLYLDLELSDKQFQKRYSEDFQNDYVFNDNFFRIDPARQLNIPEGTDYNTYIIDSIKLLVEATDAKIVIIDNMTKLVSSDTDKAKVAKPLMDDLNNLKFEHNLTLLLLEHTRKTECGRPISLNDLQGSKMKSNFADSVFSIGVSTKDKNMRYIKQLKCRSAEIEYTAENVPVYEVVKENSFLHFKFFEEYDREFNHIKGVTDEDRETQRAEAKELHEQGVSKREVARRLGVSEGAVRKWLKKPLIV